MSRVVKSSPQWAADVLLDSSAGRANGTTTVQLQESIRKAIRTGRLAAGSLLPPSRILADELSCSRSVVVKAYQQLAIEGYLQSRQGSGTIVADVPQRPASALATPKTHSPRYTFSPGVADLSSFPRSEWTDAFRHVMATATRDELHYSSPNGNIQLRAALSERLARVRGVIAHPDDIHVCSGTVQALCLLARVLVQEGHQSVAMEDPTWDQLLPPVESAGLHLVPVRLDSQGLCVTDLWTQPETRAVVLTPAHQFPTGAVMPASRRTEVLEWAKAHDAVMIEDDYDAEFNYGRPQFALQREAPNQVVYLGTTSKILSPALRLSWMVTPPWLTHKIHQIRTSYDLGVPVLDQLVLTHLISTGLLDRHLRRTRPKYDRRRRALITALRAEFDDVEVSSAPAGLHLLARFPNICSEERLVAEAARRSVSVLNLSKFRLGNDENSGPTLVLGYANMSEDAIIAGVKELHQAWQTMRDSIPGNETHPRAK